MRITVTSHKGGVGKTVTAVHLATYLSQKFGDGSTLLVDADPNLSAVGWSQRGWLPFDTVDSERAGELMPDYGNTVIDTQGRPRGKGLERVVDGCDLLVIPTTPDAMSLEALMMMARDLDELGGRANYKVLLTVIPPPPIRSGPRAAAALEKRGIPFFEAQIRRREAFAKASLSGVPVYEVRDRRAHQGWEDYERVGQEVIGA